MAAQSPSSGFSMLPVSPSAILSPGPETGMPMSGSMNWEPVRKRLLGDDMKIALQAATEIRDGIEIVHTVEFPLMLSALLPAFSSILAHKTTPSPDCTTIEHKLRNVVLEVISRMPSNEVLRPHAPHLVAVALDVLNRDYEENALIASRIIFDLYKVYRSLPQDYVQPYLDFVQNAYRALPTSVQRNFLLAALAAGTSPDSQSKGSSAFDLGALDSKEADPSNVTPAKATAAGASTPTTKPESITTPAATTTASSPSMAKLPTSPVPKLSPRSNASFRVLTECPLSVMLMFQLYPKFLRSNIPILINVMMEALALRAPPINSIVQAGQSLDANSKRLYFSRCRELVAAQAKTLSFLTYLLRGFSNDLKPYEDRLASNVVALMSTCPREFISTRKELLVATRHLLNSEFRNGFFRHVDALLDERVLMGSHHRYSEQTILRPLGYTTLSDLVHHVRSLLNMTQMSRVVSTFSRVLHDSSMHLPISTQYTAVRTLLSIVDIIFHNKDRNPQIGRDLLVRIMKTLVEKLSTLRDSDETQSKNDNLLQKSSKNTGVESESKESQRDLKSMIRAIIVGHKTLIWYINNYRAQRDKEKLENTPPQPGANEEVASAMLKMTHSEHAIIDRYILLAFPCMKRLKGDAKTSNDGKTPTPVQYRDALSYFAAAFTTLDGCDMRRTLGKRLYLLVDAIVDDQTAIVVPRHILSSNASASFEFCGMLLEFLVERMDEFMISRPEGIMFVPPTKQCDGSSEVRRLKKVCSLIEQECSSGIELRKARSTAYLQLFERVLKSLTSFPQNEKALRPYLRKIVSVCLRSATEKADFKHDNYCMILRYVFRSISAGKFEESYRELLPLIPTVFNGLYRIFCNTDDVCLHHIVIELLLTIPARLSSLLPHMNLLLRVIIRALESNSGDLVNLGLRTMEFWVDNLNPEFLFPELSKERDHYVRLMEALSVHLKPAPYPYGLLTLRLLGKLGGKNRQVLREMFDISSLRDLKDCRHSVNIKLGWRHDVDKAVADSSRPSVESSITPTFEIPLPIERCVEILKTAAFAQELTSDAPAPLDDTTDTSVLALTWGDSEKLLETEIEQIDLLPYCTDVIKQTRRTQVDAALTILRSAVTKMIGIEVATLEVLDRIGVSTAAITSPPVMADEADESFNIQTSSEQLMAYSKDLETVCLGLMFGCALQPDQGSILRFMKGFVTHMFLIVTSHQEHIIRIDANGSALHVDNGQPLGQTPKDPVHGSLFEVGLGSLKPFGYFKQTGPLKGKTDPMVINSSLAKLLSYPYAAVKNTALDLLRHLLRLPEKLALKGQHKPASTGSESALELDRGSRVFFESLLSAICRECVSCDWHRRDGLYEGIILIIETLGSSWSQKYEIELITVGLFAAKSVPREMSVGAVKAFQFLVQVCNGVYGHPTYPGLARDSFLFDVLSVHRAGAEHGQEKSQPSSLPKNESTNGTTPSEEVLQVILVEIASTRQIVRLASRYILKHYMIDRMSATESKLSLRRHMTLLKRVLFSRSLRLLPLPEQVGTVEALSVIVDQLPDLIPLNDQHLLAFLSELLKMSSVADGEMADANLGGYVVDKNGHAVRVEEKSSTSKSVSMRDFSTALFSRRDCVVQVPGGKLFLDGELPPGVQLRVSSISLLRSVIRGHPNPFFDAETTSPIGNIRPHVVSLLFRSLVSSPLKAVIAAHDALRDVLTLSVVSNEEGAKSKSRLRKELLQTCIRPVLLNLRDYTRLSVNLLRGLSRLLSLLSSWFNKTLGEKLLDHLQKWTDPNRMKSQNIWKEGEEPDVAAAIVDLFVLLPHASQFVEPLVKTVIKLEASLPAFKSRHVASPYRKPLARYLNKHCQYTVSFFFQRLKTPLYSELFQDIIQLEDSVPLREYLSGRQCSVSLLNVCFERPLAIIRSEKTQSAASGMSPPKALTATNSNDIFFLHGIQPHASPQSQNELLLRQEVDKKKKKLLILQQELARATDAVKSKNPQSKSPASEGQPPIEELRKQHKIAKAAYERGAKELNESKQRYSAEVAKSTSAAKASKDPSARPMNIESLELQHQGFRLVEALMQADKNYLKDHNDVLRAFRWLWRSKGRYLRLQHEEYVPPRYHSESKMLASFLINYARNFPNDVDLLFELIRIFLQSCSSDFSFVKSFLSDAVGQNLSANQKKQIMQRFFTLLAGESTEEIKTLSVQLVVYPMLDSSFREVQAKLTGTVVSPINTPTSPAEGRPHEAQERGQYEFIDASVVKKFIEEVLFQKGRPVACGDRLRIELLRLANLFLEFVPAYAEPMGKDLIKFCWNLLKSDDIPCKNWAYLVICRFISALDTPAKIILQVYVALLRSHQQEAKGLVRKSLDLLVPSLPKRLDASDMRKMMEWTTRIMFEEGNSIPQLAHIWQTIVGHSEVYYAHRYQFVRYMVNSLNRLGLPPNCQPENRALAVSVIELVIRWENFQGTTTDSRSDDMGKKRGVGVSPSADSQYVHSDKRRKTAPSGTNVSVPSRNFLLDQSMVDTMSNFIVRLKILLADPKVDTGSSRIGERLVPLFSDLLARWQHCLIRPVYFEKVVSMCKEHNLHEKTGRLGSNTRSNAKKSPPKSQKSSASGSSSQKGDESKQLSAALLIACLDVFIVLSQIAPGNGFLWDNPFQVKEVVAACFRFARNREEAQVREKLSKFLVNLIASVDSKKAKNSNLAQFACVLLENCLVDGEMEYSRVSNSTPGSPDSHRHAGSRPTVAEGDETEDVIASFALDVIKEISRTHKAFFERFSTTLIKLLNTLVKKHASAAASKQKQGGVCFVPQSGTYSIRQMYHTPVIGILTESFPPEVSQWTNAGTTVTSKNRDSHVSKELQEFGRPLRSTVMILEMLGNSDIVYSFTQNRKSLFQVISSILESSNNVQLLLAAVRIVGKWLLSDLSGGPLTVKERNSFLWKISSFDFNGLSDVVAQPLADLVSHYVITFLRRRIVKLKAEGLSDKTGPNGTGPVQVVQRVGDSDDIILGRSLMACLMTANHALRDTLLALYVSQRGDATEIGHVSGEEKIPLCSPVEILWQLLHSDFEGLGGRYWIAVFVDLLLTCARTLPLAEERSLVPVGKSIQRMLPAPKKHASGAVPFSFDKEMRAEYASFCKEMLEERSNLIAGGYRVATALRRLAHGDVSVCQLLFQKLLRAGWDAAHDDSIRLRLVPAIESLLSRPFHSQFLKRLDKLDCQRACNMVRAFLNGLSELSPLPVVDIDLLVSLAETYNSWYEVLAIIEDQYLVFSANELSSSGVELRKKMLRAMRHCYRQLGESNVVMGLAMESCNMPETRRAVSLDVYGKVDEALDSYTSLMELVESRGAPASETEMNLWEERWVHLNREQCQLPVVSEYASASNSTQLMLECAWKQQDWDKVRSLCSSPDLVAAAESGEPSVKMSETLLAVVDGKLSDVENLHAQTAQLCLYKWQLLPGFTSTSLAHASLLHFFHRLVEIRESGHIMVETNNHSNGKKTLPDLKNLLNAWRHRLPNDFEDLAMWDEIFTWRSHMFNAITSNFHWSEPSTLATLHDRPWTAIRMSITARKQGLRQTALLLLNRLTDSRAMDVSDAYLKLREQILAYNNPESELERTGGLNLINTTNLSFFDAKQKSELFRLKAIFLSSLRRTSKSNQAYCHSVQICPTYAKAWVSWGGLCSSLGALTEKQLDQMAAKGGSAENSKETRAATTKKVAQYLAQAMGCYLEAVQIDAHEKSRIHLPKCLWILTKDGSSPGVLCQTLENRGAKLPPWVWLPWIPQLLTGLCRIEGRAMKTILTCLVKAYPQAVYYSLRAFYLERRDVERAKGVSSSSSQHMPSVAHAEEMMSTLRRSHASLWSSLEAILEELIVKFRPSYEEELLATISALLERAESHAEKQYLPDKKRLEDEDAMVASWSKTLSRIAAKFFRASDAATGSNRRDERVKKTADFKRKYKQDFEADFKVSSSEGQSESASPDAKPQFRLREYIERLQRWKRKLEAQVSCTPVSLPLVESSHALAMFAGDVPDLWPGACDTKYMSMNNQDGHDDEDDANRGQSSTSSSAAIARKAALTAALAAADAAAKEGAGGEFGGGSATIEIPGQYCPNSAASADIKPCPELHAKLVRFEPCVDVLRRNDQLVRRAGMIGSDGRTYRFLLQFAIPYWTRTDERTAQTHYVIDKFLRQNLMAAKNHLSIQPNAAIPVAQRLRMTLDVDSRIALDDVWRVCCESKQVKVKQIPAQFLDEVSQKMNSFGPMVNDDERNAKERTVRLDVYTEICKNKVDNRSLLRYVQSTMEGPERLFYFRRAFSGQLAANSLLQHIFSVAERTPQRFVILQNTARILSPDFRVCYSNQGFIENQLVPFRMTPNVEALIGKPYVEGRFIKAFAMIATAVREHREHFDPILRLLMRDDILAWYSKSLAKTDSKTQELERQLIERVSKNVQTLQAKFSECAANPKHGQGKAPIDGRVRELYASATNPDKLCMMPTSYHAWL